MTRPVPVAAWLALMTVGMLPACTHRASPQERAAVERMILTTDSLRAELDRADTNALRHMGDLFRAERPAMEARFGDTLLPREAEVLGNYHRAMAEFLPAVLAQHQAYREHLDSTAGRLHQLRHDLEEGLLDQEQRRTALAMEQRWVELLRQETRHTNQQAEALIRDRGTWRAAIDSLLHP